VQLPCPHHYRPLPPRVPIPPRRRWSNRCPTATRPYHHWRFDRRHERSDHASVTTGPYRRWRFDRHPERFDHASTATRPHRCWHFDCGLRWSDRPWTSGWRSDRPTLRDFFIAYFIDLRRAPCYADAFDCVPRGAHDSTRAFCGSGIPALLTSPSGCARATDTASTSAITAGEGRTGDTFSQPSSNDHAGEAELSATDRQTHIVGHLVIAALSSAHLYPRCPR
jgi:hypothetical protein